MTHHHRSPDPSPDTAAIVPPAIVSLMVAFRDFFTAPVWDHVLVLVTGAVLTPGKRTVSAVLRIMGLSEAADFALYHHVLSQAHWDSRIIARKLLSLILERLLPAGDRRTILRISWCTARCTSPATIMRPTPERWRARKRACDADWGCLRR